MKISTIVSIVTIAFLTGCGSKDKAITEAQENAPDVVNIDISSAKDFSEDLDSIGEVVFDETCQQIMGVPHNVVVRGDTIFAIDANQSPGIYAYLNNGKQILAYCSKGSAPSDIWAPGCLAVTDTEISVCESGKIVVIDKEGNFKRKIDVPIMAHNAIIDQSGGVWVDFTNQDYEEPRLMWKKDSVSEFVEVQKVPDFLKGVTVIEIQSLQHTPNGNVMYQPVYEPRIYELNDGNITIKYELDFNSLWPDEDVIKAKFVGNDWAIKRKNFPIKRMRFHESNKYLVIGFMYNEGERFLVIYNKRTNKSHTYKVNTEKYISSIFVTDSKLYMVNNNSNLEIFKIKD